MRLTITLASTALAGVLALSPLAFAQTTVRSFAPVTNTDPGVWFENDVRTGGTARVVDLTGLGSDLDTDQPLPIGAALITTDLTNPAKAEVGVLDNYGKPEDIFATLRLLYSYYKAASAGQNLAAAPVA